MSFDERQQGRLNSQISGADGSPVDLRHDVDLGAETSDAEGIGHCGEVMAEVDVGRRVQWCGH